MVGAMAGVLTRTLIEATRPMVTPRKVTGEPAVSPDSESVNTAITCSVCENQRVPPNTSVAATPSSRAPSTKPPTTAGLAGVTGGLRVHERMHERHGALLSQCPRSTVGNCSARVGIQKHAVVAGREQGRQFVADHDYGDTEAI